MILPAFLVFLTITGLAFGWISVPLFVLLLAGFVLFAFVRWPQP